MINFQQKTGYFNYQGALIYADGKTYAAMGLKHESFGAAVQAIKEARRALAVSLIRSDLMHMDENKNMFACGIKNLLKKGVTVEKIAYDLYSQSLDNRRVMVDIIGESLLSRIEKLCS